MGKTIRIDGDDHEVWDSPEERERLGLDDVLVIGIPAGDGDSVTGTVSLGPDGIYFRVEEKLFAMDLRNTDAMCKVFAAVIETTSERMRVKQDVNLTAFHDALATLSVSQEEDE